MNNSTLARHPSATTLSVPVPISPHPIDVRAAIDRAAAHFQPIVDLATGDIVGAEALVRFIDPNGGVRTPSGLIERIEETLGDLEALTWRVFCDIEKHAGPLLSRHPTFFIGVNVPPLLLGSPRLKQMLEDSGLARYMNQLVCEITERQALTQAGREALAAARPLGLRIALDDFGTGQSGLKQLIGLPVDTLKVDKSEVDPLLKDPTADRLLRGVVALAAALRVKVVAEGVETKEQAFFLHAAGVDAAQGWLWSKAVPPDKLERLVATGLRVGARRGVEPRSRGHAGH
ncbi:MAG: EAL domain-containing protein [Phycisphaeraceae bacterium]|nr:EAL domain-containing protein [Phycisphaeraceae bacterium]